MNIYPIMGLRDEKSMRIVNFLSWIKYCKMIISCYFYMNLHTSHIYMVVYNGIQSLYDLWCLQVEIGSPYTILQVSYTKMAAILDFDHFYIFYRKSDCLTEFSMQCYRIVLSLRNKYAILCKLLTNFEIYVKIKIKGVGLVNCHF